MKKALITGITGQDGSYLARLLLTKGYEVHGLRRRSSSFNTGRLESVLAESNLELSQLSLHYGDLTDSSSLIELLQTVRPNEVYNLGAMSHVGVSFKIPETTADVNGLGTLRLLEAMRIAGLNDSRFYQASTSELFGLVQEIPQKESTPFYPRSPYAISKLFAYWTVVNYREAYNFFACNGILFNHESPYRGENFVTQKIVQGLVKVKMGKADQIQLGNLNAMRDWGHAEEYVAMQWMMLQASSPVDYVIATGRQSSVREFVQIVADLLDLQLEWRGEGLSEVGFSHAIGREVITISRKHFRPAEVDTLLGDASLASQRLGWTPKISLRELAIEMISVQLRH